MKWPPINTGNIVGESTIRRLMVYYEEGMGNYIALGRIEGKIERSIRQLFTLDYTVEPDDDSVS